MPCLVFYSVIMQPPAILLEMTNPKGSMQRKQTEQQGPDSSSHIDNNIIRGRLHDMPDFTDISGQMMILPVAKGNHPIDIRVIFIQNSYILI